MRALRELLYNSAKYSDGQNIKLIVERKDNIVRFVVEDTGKTITEADSKNIFKFFMKVDDLTEGLGLGLPLAKRHAQTLGGDLILDTNYHDGCRFIIEIPFS
jgi:signal transduction histidine kinase